MGLGTAVLLLFSASSAGRIGMAPLATEGLSDSERSFSEENTRQAFRRYGLPIDGVQDTETRVGTAALEACSLKDPRGCIATKGVYQAIIVGDVKSSVEGYSGQLAAVDTANGSIIAAESFASPDSRGFLDARLAATRRLSNRIAAQLGVDIPLDAPLRGISVYPLVAGGVLIATGTYFLLEASSDSNALKSPSTSFPDAVNARNSGSTNLTLGIALTSLGVISTIVGVVFYAPGAERKPLVRLQVDPFQQRIALSGVLP